MGCHTALTFSQLLLYSVLDQLHGSKFPGTLAVSLQEALEVSPAPYLWISHIAFAGRPVLPVNGL